MQREFQGSFKGVSRKFKGCPRKVFMMFQGSFKGVSRKGVPVVFSKCFKGV